MDTDLDASLQIPAPAWGRLASVVRTVEWAAAQPDRLALAPYLGANCGRLMDQALELMVPPPPDLEPALLRARALLAGLDARPPREQQGALRSLRQELACVIPLSQIGAPLLPFSPQSQLLVVDEADPAPSAPEGEAATPGVEGGGAAAASAAASVDAPEPEPEPEPESEPVALPRLQLGHPEGTGAGVGELSSASPELVAALADAGIQTIAQLLSTPPAQHERVVNLPITAQVEEGAGLVRGGVVSRCLRLSPLGRRWEVVLEGAEGARLVCRWLSRAPRGWLSWVPGAQIALAGGVEATEDGALMYEAEPVGLDGRGAGLMPAYGLPGIEDAELREVLAEALAGLDALPLQEPLPATLMERYRLAPLEEALRDAHFPANTAGRGRQRLAFEELLLLQLGVAWRAGRGQPERGMGHTISHHGLTQVCMQFNLLLDNGQEQAFSDIRRDLARGEPMARLLQGDVGTGQELVALMAAIMVAESRTQVAMVSPDPLAAERRYLFAEGMLRAIGAVPLLVGDQLTHGQADAIRRGEAHVLFGTRRILAPDVQWRRLGLVIVDERDEHGTVPPAQLPSGKGPRPDLLVTTPVPVPSALLFTVFGDFDVSVIPGFRQLQVEERVYDAGQRAAAYAAALEQIQAGRQAFVVLPVRDGRDLLSTEDAVRMAKALQAEAFPGRRIGVYCSAMPREERHRVFEDFQHRRVDVLVCTTYIEDAPLLDNATVMVVEYADLHDMTRLHRLRGHVGRGPRRGQIHHVLSDDPDDRGRDKVEQVVREPDGFQLAELELLSRGSAAALQDGGGAELPDFSWAEPARDRPLVLRARVEALALLRESPALRRWPELVAALHARWGDWFGDSLPAGEDRRPGGSGGASSRRRRRRRRS